MQTLAMVLWTTTILLEVKAQEDELWDPWADNCESMVPCNLTEPQTDPMPYIVTLNRPYINSDQAGGVRVYKSTTAAQFPGVHDSGSGRQDWSGCRGVRHRQQEDQRL
ncbi:uncharacterized protein LOC124373727 [Homalodisca vitripennis]|uniref:uncharacterized protein LOC124373727 n=1 Tax=Homalodisca vitripennis TaxID=197043 RepID=UPI001EEA4376|nr:uncharacterized protein LOC124373727 [Homalodisca vitripennis]